MTPDTSVQRATRVVQMAFPQIYLACHTRHQRKRSTPHRVSARDAAILAHLSVDRPTTPTRLAAHLGIGKSTLSEATKRLAALGFLIQGARSPRGGARGGVSLLLTPKGAAVIEDTSVLEVERLRAALAMLTSAERRVVERGMDTLATACRRISEDVGGA